MGTLIDSSVLIAAERGKLDLDAVLASHCAEDVGVSTITVSELLHGVHRADGRHRALREASIEAMLARLTIFPFDLAAARAHARAWASLAAKGTNVAAHDLLIAATALSLGHSVATRDVRSFLKVPGLTVLRW